MPNIMKALQFMLDVANDNSHGYDQTKRNGPDYDCSSLVGTALKEGGFNVSPYSWTGNLRSQLLECGFKQIPVNDSRKAGDIFLTEGKHVVMCVDANTIVHASINEKGTATGGKSGDQTGKEICTRSFYAPSYGWKFHFRYTGANTEVKPDVSLDTVAREVIAGKWGNGDDRKKRLESAGYNYSELQKKVNNILTGKELKTDGEIAREVIAGKWGNGDSRRNKLLNAGYDHTVIQKLVNNILKG